MRDDGVGCSASVLHPAMQSRMDNNVPMAQKWNIEMTMNNQHEIAMVMHWHGRAINSQAKGANYYRTYAKEADSWAARALSKANGAERSHAIRMTRKDNAVEVFVCLVGVAFMLTLGVIIVEQLVATIISYVGAWLFFITAVAYSWQEYRYRKNYRKHLNARLDEMVEGGLDVTA